MNHSDCIHKLCGNHVIYEEILSWLESFNYNQKISEKSCIFVVGNSCIGKTYSLNHICKYLKYYAINIDTNNCWNSAQFKDLIFKSITSCLVQSIQYTNMNKVIIIDNFESLFSADKTVNQALLQILKEKKLKNIPIICITNPETIKKLGDIKNLCNTYELTSPSINDIKYILKLHNLKNQEILQLIKKTHGNLEQIFTYFHDKTYYQNDNNIINKNQSICNYDRVDDQYDIIYLYKCACFDRNIIRNIVQNDAWLIPLRFHENLIVELSNRNGTIKKKNIFYIQFINLFCYFDVLMNSNNIECALEIFVSIIYFLSVFKANKGNLSNMSKFTKILSYLSLQKKYIKHYFNSNFPIYQIGNYHTCLLNRKFIYFN